jgi:CRISPR/Cas system Type II protein with McrA/HNH and RuvC-like nuclease domain
MSHEDDKLKHSKRIHQEESVIAKQLKIAKTHGMQVKEPHKLAKHHALDCGVPNCPMCSSPRKVTGEKTIQEQSFEQTEKWND